MLNIVLLAPNGQVGFEVARAIAPLGRLFTISRNDVDFSNIEALTEKVSALAPNIIINAAAWTAVDKAETEVESCNIINALLPEALARLASKHHAWLVHYSSDYVYPGSGELPWQETDNTAPLSVYGKTKLAGDLAIMQNTQRYLIFRTSWVYAARGSNFMRTMLKLAQTREALNIVADQVGAPTPARLIAQVTVLALYKIRIQEQLGVDVVKQYAGIYHLAPRGYCSWYEFAAAIFTLARENEIPLVLETEQFKAISTAEYPTPARRPFNSRLNLEKIEQTFGLILPHWQQQLAATFNELIAQ